MKKLSRLMVVLLVFVGFGFGTTGTFQAEDLTDDYSGSAFGGCLDWVVLTNLDEQLEPGNLGYVTLNYHAPNGCSNIGGETISINLTDKLKGTKYFIDDDHFESSKDGNNFKFKFKESLNDKKKFGGFFTIAGKISNEGNNLVSNIYMGEDKILENEIQVFEQYVKNDIGKYVNNGYGTWDEGTWLYYINEGVTRINYQVDVNSNNRNLSNVETLDILGVNQDYIEESLIIYDSEFNNVTSDFELTTSDHYIEIDFGDISEEYHVYYSVDVKNFEHQNISNVSMYSDELNADAYVIFEIFQTNNAWDYKRL